MTTLAGASHPVLSFIGRMPISKSSITLTSSALVVGLLHFHSLDVKAGEANVTPSNCALGGTAISLDVQSASRRTIIVQLSGSEVAVQWRDRQFADQTISRRLRGTCEVLIAEILKPSSYSIVYQRDGAHYRVSRIILVGARPEIAEQETAVPLRSSIPTRLKNRQLQTAAKSEQFQKLLSVQIKEKLRAARRATGQ